MLTALQQDERASLRELCETCGIRSTSQVYVLLKELEREGLITRKDGARMIYLTKAGRKFRWQPEEKPVKSPVLSRAIHAAHARRGEMALPRLSKEEQARRIEQVVQKAAGRGERVMSYQLSVSREPVVEHVGRIGGCKVG